MYFTEILWNLCHDSLYGNLWIVLLAGSENCRYRSVGVCDVDTYCDIYGDSWSFSCRKAGASAAVGRECRRTETFILVALAGNIIGMLLTVQSGGGTVYSSGYRMEKEETGAYEEKFIVSVDGKKPAPCMCRCRKRKRKSPGKSRN